jgi:GTPase SAR1 family protein
MNRKIILVGPPEGGKTTLRKIFFEGENSTRILDYGLEPTRGHESILLNLRKKVGIFDLGGQENQRWFESEERSIFYETKVIIVVLDISSPIENILEFIQKILKIRNDLTPLSHLIILLHKIDLVNQETKRRISQLVYIKIEKAKLVSIYLTSVKREYIADTFSNFIDIIKVCIIDEIELEDSTFYLLDEILKIVYLTYKQEFIHKTEFLVKLNRSERIIDRILNHLIKNGHLQFSGIQEKDKTFFLTTMGKENFSDILENLTLEKYLERSKIKSLQTVIPKTKAPFIFGVFLINKKGKVMLISETFENDLYIILKENFQQSKIQKYSYNDLIQNFKAALEIFVKESKVQNLSGINLIGGTLYFLEIHGLILSMIAHPHADCKKYENIIRKMFEKTYKGHKLEFDILNTGSSIYNAQLIQVMKNWLIKINNLYNRMLENLNTIDISATKKLYSELEDLSFKINVDNVKVQEKIKRLKISLMNNLIEENFTKIKEIADDIITISSEYK